MTTKEGCEKVIEPVQEPDILGYALAYGNAFDGIYLEGSPTGLYQTHEEAVEAPKSHVLDGWYIVPIYCS